ncbi:MAG TPA: hypothetical protein VGF86_15075 [Candidatus Tumulicola sp.]|jgi:hypothetical protein
MRANLKSFDAVAKHLFRHLHDFEKLRANPIARRFFEQANALGSPWRARQALKDLRALVLETAERIHSADSTNGSKRDLADRQFAIIKMQYFDGVALEKVADMLHLSVKHCYRERAAICRRIARALSPHDKTRAQAVVANKDSFYFLLDRLLDHQASTSLPELDACQYLQSYAETALQRLEALRAFTLLSLALGDDSAAEATYVRAKRLYDDQVPPLPVELQLAAEASMSLLAWALANHRGDGALALTAAERAVMCLERGQVGPSMHTDLLQVQARFNLATALWAGGNLSRAFDVLEQSIARCDRLRSSSPIRIRAEASLWKLRTYLLLDTPYTLKARLGALESIKERAVGAGALSEALDAMVSITEGHVFAKQDVPALQSVRETLVLARSALNTVEQIGMTLELGVRLLSTRFWREALSMLPTQNDRGKLSMYRNDLMTFAMALGALKAGNLETAYVMATAVASDRRWASLCVRRGLVAAESAYLLGRASEAGDLAQAAVEAAERLGAAPVLRDAYCTASLIVGKARFESSAQEIGRILAT